MAHPLRWVPNALTIVRLAALPVLLVVLIEAEGPTSPLAAGIFGVVASTDFVDGNLARAWNAETRFGRIADPLADRLLVGLALVGVILLDRMSPLAPVDPDRARRADHRWPSRPSSRRGIEMRVDMAGQGLVGAHDGRRRRGDPARPGVG